MSQPHAVWKSRIFLVALASSSIGCIWGYRAGGSVMVDTTRNLSVGPMTEAYAGVILDRCQCGCGGQDGCGSQGGKTTYDLEVGPGLSGGLRTGPLRGVISPDARLSFRATLPKVAFVTGAYVGQELLIGGDELPKGSSDGGAVIAGLAFAVQPFPKGPSHEVGVEARGGFATFGTPQRYVGQFALRVYYDHMGMIGYE